MSSSKHENTPSHSSKSQLQSANRLLIEAIKVVVSIVEAMHHRINPLSPITSSANEDKTAGVTGLVYNTIQNVTGMVGKGLDKPLGVISEVLGKTKGSSNNEAFISALNGVLGNYLAKQESALAIQMSLKYHNETCRVQDAIERLKQTDGRLVIMIHGLCMNHLQWTNEGHNHGQQLSEDLNLTTVYLHYNTGLHIFENGHALSTLLEEWVTHILAIEPEMKLEISIVAHSMGGLVSRSACYQAEKLSKQWPNYLKKLFFLGTPHHGAPLERLGSWIDGLLSMHSYTLPLSRITTFRSAGIQDLRYGSIDESEQVNGMRKAISLPKQVSCFTIATTSSQNPNAISDSFIGDGLVPLNSALGKHEEEAYCLDFPSSHQWVGQGINHMDLLSNQDVYMQIQHWLSKA